MVNLILSECCPIIIVREISSNCWISVSCSEISSMKLTVLCDAFCPEMHEGLGGLREKGFCPEMHGGEGGGREGGGGGGLDVGGSEI